jgi:hypothetical protein
MKLRYTIVIEEEIIDLSHFEAKDVEEAAKNMTGWLKDGSADLMEVVGNGDIIQETIEGIA